MELLDILSVSICPDCQGVGVRLESKTGVLSLKEFNILHMIFFPVFFLLSYETFKEILKCFENHQFFSLVPNQPLRKKPLLRFKKSKD